MTRMARAALKRFVKQILMTLWVSADRESEYFFLDFVLGVRIGAGMHLVPGVA
jgi:hypothetical protein